MYFSRFLKIFKKTRLSNILCYYLLWEISGTFQEFSSHQVKMKLQFVPSNVGIAELEKTYNGVCNPLSWCLKWWGSTWDKSPGGCTQKFEDMGMCRSHGGGGILGLKFSKQGSLSRRISLNMDMGVFGRNLQNHSKMGNFLPKVIVKVGMRDRFWQLE